MGILLLLQGCSKALMDSAGVTSTTTGTGGLGATIGSAVSTAVVNQAYNTTVNWSNTNSVEAGQAAPGGTLFMVGLEESGTEANFPTCFDNNRACRRASAYVQSNVFNDPVAIQAFQLNFTYSDQSGTSTTNVNWDQVVIDAASVTTQPLRFNANTGALALGTAISQQLVSGTVCNLNDSTAVGYASDPNNPQILTGLHLFEEAEKTLTNQNVYTNAHITAGRVWYSGIYPDGSWAIGYPFAFRYIPFNAADTSDFGLQNFSNSSSSGTLASPVFGTASSVAGAGNYVITGFCIEGRKIKAGATRPLLYYGEVYTGAPYLQKL